MIIQHARLFLARVSFSKSKHDAEGSMKSAENRPWVSNELSGRFCVSAAFIHFLSEIVIVFVVPLHVSNKSRQEIWTREQWHSFRAWPVKNQVGFTPRWDALSSASRRLFWAFSTFQIISIPWKKFAFWMVCLLQGTVRLYPSQYKLISSCTVQLLCLQTRLVLAYCNKGGNISDLTFAVRCFSQDRFGSFTHHYLVHYIAYQAPDSSELSCNISLHPQLSIISHSLWCIPLDYIRQYWTVILLTLITFISVPQWEQRQSDMTRQISNPNKSDMVVKFFSWNTGQI